MATPIHKQNKCINGTSKSERKLLRYKPEPQALRTTPVIQPATGSRGVAAVVRPSGKTTR